MEKFDYTCDSEDKYILLNYPPLSRQPYFFFRSITVLQGTKKLKLTKMPGTTRKNASLVAENLIGFQIYIECHVSNNLVNLNYYSVTSRYVDVT